MAQKITYDRTVSGSVVTETHVFTNGKIYSGALTNPVSIYSALATSWEIDEREFRDVFTGEYKRKSRGYYLTVKIAFESIGNARLFALRNIFDVDTMNLRYYPDTATAEYYDMSAPSAISLEDFLETYQSGFEIELRSKNRYKNPIPQDIGYIGCRKIDLSYHIRLNGSEI